MSRPLTLSSARPSGHRGVRAGLLLALLLVLSGCLKYELMLVVDEDDTLTGTLIVAVAREFAVGEDIFGRTGELTPSEGSVTKEAYEDADYIGSRYIITGVPISEIDSLSTDSSTRFSLTHEGHEYVLDASIDFNFLGSEPGPTQASFTAMVSFTFPGAVTESNGMIDGNTVVWSQLRPDAENTLTARASAIPNGQASAASASGSGIPWWIWGIVTAGALVVVVILVILLLRRRRAAQTAQGAAPGAWAAQEAGGSDQYGNWIPTAGYGQESGYYDSGQADGYGSYYGTYGDTPSGVYDYQTGGNYPAASGSVTGDTYGGPPGTAPAPLPTSPQPGYAQPGYPDAGYPQAGHPQAGHPPPVHGWVARPPT